MKIVAKLGFSASTYAILIRLILTRDKIRWRAY